MPINLESLNVIQDNTKVFLNNDGTLQKASFFSRKSTIDQNKQNIVNSLKQTIASDPKYFGVQKHLEGMIDGLMTSKLSSRGITAGQIKDILAYADSLSTPEEQKKSFMSGAMHTAVVLHQNQDKSAKFGLPTSLAGSSKEIKDAYSNAFHNTFKNIFANTEDLRSVNIENTIRQFDENTALIKSTFKELGLPNNLENTFFANTVGKNYSKEQLKNVCDYYKAINNNQELSASQKSILYDTVVADNGPLDKNSFYLLVLMRENMFVYDKASSSPEFTATIKKELSAMNFDENSVQYMQNQVADAVINDVRELVPYKIDATPEELQTFAAQAKKVTPQMIQDFINKELGSYRAAIQEVKDYANGNAALEKIGMKTISNVKGVPKAGYLTALHNASQELNPVFKQLTTNINTVSLDRFNTVLEQLSGTINDYAKTMDKKGLPELGMFNANLADHILGESVSSLSADERRGLFNRLSSPAGENLFYMHTSDYQNADSLLIAQNMSLLRDKIALIDNLEAKPFSNNSEQKCDYTKLSCSMQAKHSLDNLLSGDLAKELPLKEFSKENYNRSFAQTAESMLQLNFLTEMQKMQGGNGRDTIFEKDIKRGLQATLSNGVKLANQYEDAKKQLAEYISHGQVHNYADLNPAQTCTAQILMTCLSQETEKMINMGVPLALNGEKRIPAFFTMGDGDQNAKLPGGGRSFNVVEDGSGGFEIQYECTRAIDGFQITKDNPELIRLGADSQEHYEINIHIPGDEIERLQTVDFRELPELPKNPKIDDLMNWKTNFDFGAYNIQNVTITGGCNIYGMSAPENF